MALKVFAVSIVRFLELEPTSTRVKEAEGRAHSQEETELPLPGQRCTEPQGLPGHGDDDSA